MFLVGFVFPPRGFNAVTQTPHLFLFSSIELLTPAQGTECFVLSGQTADPAPRRLCLGTVSLLRLLTVMCCHVIPHVS